MRMNAYKLFQAVGITFLVVCSPASSDDDTKQEAPEINLVTLYRNSVVDSNMRIHIATFDVVESNPSYNSENCQIAADLFEAQRGVVVRYWCERGRYRREWE